jgi:CBS domain-containing protein
MSNEMLDDEMSQMYEDGTKTRKTLDSTTLHKPIKYLRVKKPRTLLPGNTVAEAVELMKSKNIGCVLITEQEKLVGIFTERDILTKVMGKKNHDQIKIADVMTRRVDAFQQEDSLAYVLNAMHVGGYRHVPVVDEHGKPMAVISVKDIIAFILEHFAEDVLNLPSAPIRKTHQREGA